MLLLACACGPEPTPLPVILPTLTPTVDTSATSTPAPLRYALAPDILPFLSEADRAAISASATLVTLDAPPNPADLGATYDLVVTTGALPGSSPAPGELQVSLRIDPAIPPLNDPDLANTLRLAVDPQVIAQALGIPPEQAGASPTLTVSALRADLANAGYPDGFDVTLAANGIPGAETLAASLALVGIEAREVSNQPAHLTLMATTPDTGDSILLYRLPIRFLAADGLNITFTESGFPVARRSG